MPPASILSFYCFQDQPEDQTDVMPLQIITLPHATSHLPGRKVVCLLMLWCFLLCNNGVTAQAPAAKYLHNVWTTENGLPQNSINALVQTREGYLWLGTHGGLARFDGVRFQVFEPGNTPELKSSRIISLFEDHAGNLWIGTQYGGLTRYANGVFKTYSTQDGFPDAFVASIAEDGEGNIWCATSRGLVQLSAGRLTLVRKDSARQAFKTRDGSVWFASGPKLLRYQAGSLTTYALSEDAQADDITSFAEASDGSLWLTAGPRLMRFDGGSFSTRALPAPSFAGGQAKERFLRFIPNPQGRLLLLTESGLAHWEDGQWRRFAPELARLFEQSNSVLAVLEDREGNVWCGASAGGLQRFKPAQVTSYTSENGLSDDSFVTITEDGTGGLWLATSNNKLFHYANGRFTPYDRPPPVWTLLHDRAGHLWVGRGNLFRLKDGQTTEYTRAQLGLAGAPLAALFEDQQGQLWIGMGNDNGRVGGLFRFHAGPAPKTSAYRTSEGLVHDGVYFITEDHTGALWVGTTGGLSRFQDGQFTNYTMANGLPHNYVRAIHEDMDGVLWIGSYGGGLCRLKDGRLTPITAKHGLYDNIISRILEDDRGNLWMSCNRGIFRASRRELNDFAEGRAPSVNCVFYGISDGMKDAECNGGGQPAGWKNTDGRLWFPTKQGVAVIDPHQMNPLPPPVVIEQALADQQPIFAPGQQQAQAPPGTGNLEVSYTALSFVAPEKVRFKYRLEGYDQNWVAAGTRRSAYYTNLPPGQYAFRVIACNNDGVWNETGAALPIYMKPHFYQTKLFHVCCWLALGALGLAGYRLRVRQLVARTHELEAKVSARTAEVVQQKDELAKTNTQLTEVNQRLEHANDDLLAILNRLRLGVAIITQNDVVTYLSQAAQQFIGKTEAAALGQPWTELLPLHEQEKEHLKALIARPQTERTKLLVRLHTPAGQRYWTEIEVQDDPRAPHHKILFLYDVSEVYDLRLLIEDKAQFHNLIGESVGMQLVFKQIRDLALVDTTVLISGETGTGKELVARALHAASPRAAKPFVALNCAGLTESLVASQLFGHRRGAFTGAVSDQLGVFEAAQGGTLFLDEIGDIPPSVQTSLLRVLQEREITRLGEAKPRQIDVRVIVATHRDLEQEVAAGRFRSDLLYRIRVAQLRLPPLRERRQDIPLLASWFLKQFRPAADKGVQDVGQETMRALLAYPWPGNVRELKSALESAVIRTRGPVIQPADLPAQLIALVPAQTQPSGQPGADANAKQQRVVDALQRANGNRAAAARLLGVSRATFYRWLDELKIEKANGPQP
jgi:PAS domain S-box-containing protein